MSASCSRSRRGLRARLRGGRRVRLPRRARPHRAAPTLVIAGAEDPSTPPDVLEPLAGGIPDAALVTIADAAHLANVEQPDAFTAAVLSHLEEGRRMSDDAYERGMRVRREVLGDEHVDRAIESTTEHTADFQDLITRYAWGEIWARPGLDRRTRSAITLTALVALGHHDELAMHVRAALPERPDAGRDQRGAAPDGRLLRRARGEHARSTICQRVLEDDVSVSDAGRRSSARARRA